MPILLTWFETTSLGEDCTSVTHCADCNPSGDCDCCDTVDGRWIAAVSDYASTCDWCGEQTHHEHLTMDPKTQLGYCDDCIPKLPLEIQQRLEKKEPEEG
jgi:hypothetical protein